MFLLSVYMQCTKTMPKDCCAVEIKGGKSPSQFQLFTIAKIKLYFLIFFVLILGLRLQRYSTNTKRCPPEKSFWKL